MEKMGENTMKDRFNTIWGLIFIGLFVLVMIPLPCFCNYEYVPSIAGIPNFIIGWAAVGLTTLVLIFVWAKQCWNRPEYCEFDEDTADQKEGK